MTLVDTFFVDGNLDTLDEGGHDGDTDGTTDGDPLTGNSVGLVLGRAVENVSVRGEEDGGRVLNELGVENSLGLFDGNNAMSSTDMGIDGITEG